jgi:ribosomal protein L27
MTGPNRGRFCIRQVKNPAGEKCGIEDQERRNQLTRLLGTKEGEGHLVSWSGSILGRERKPRIMPQA